MPAPTIAIRTDSGARIGSGHVARCLSLADALQPRGARIVIVCRAQPGWLSSRLERSGHEVRRIPEGNGSWLGASERDDAAQTVEALRGVPVDWLVVDQYGAGAEWEQAARASGPRILAIDDLANRPHACDVLVDQNYVGASTSSRYDTLAPAAERLLGPRYALLQPEYAEARAGLAARNRPARRALVFFGGSDSTNETARALDALSSPPLAHLSVDVVAGANHPDPAGLDAQARARGRTAIHHDLPTLAPLMASSDMAVGGGGTTTWERLCLDLPSAVVTLVDHQVPLTQALDAEGYVKWAGRAPSVSLDSYVRAIQTVAEGGLPGHLRPLVDGLGATRLAEVLVPSGGAALSSRPARAGDAGDFFEWRNDPATRRQSFSRAPIEWSGHLRWFAGRLADPSTELHVVEINGLPVGQFRLDEAAGEALLSYALDPIVRGRGWGTALVAMAVDRARRRWPVVKAEVLRDNEPSRRIFRRLGFTETAGEDCLVYRQ
jgi:UDP-2,4-diacetamido-2,4,6-trideoxy-beta-L-altropyranose hydrolase